MADPVVLHSDDNVAILPCRARIGDDPLALGAPLTAPVPAGHKLARRAIPQGGAILKLGQFIGTATCDIPVGAHIHSHNCAFANHAADHDIGTDLARAQAAIPRAAPLTFEGYARADGRVGTRNFIALVATVNCSATVIRRAASELQSSGMLDAFPNIDGVVALAHGTGCGMAASGRGYDILENVLWGSATHPNVGAAVFVGLGCEVMQIGRMQSRFGSVGTDRLHALTIQDSGGTLATIAAIKSHVADILPRVNAISRSPQPMSALRIGLQCGGSDGFSPITANPALGVASDLIVGQGGGVILSETPEIYGAEHLLLRRAASDAVAQRLRGQIAWWQDHVAQTGGSMDNNPSPGNKQGGITTILEKSLGAVAKAGATPLRAVYDYGAQVTEPGFVFMDTPGYDPVSVTGQIAGGAQIIVFTTGRGSAFGSKPAPTLKIATTTDLFTRMPDDMDLNTGDILTGATSVAQTGHEIFRMIRATASGHRTKSELMGLGDHEFVPWQLGAVM